MADYFFQNTELLRVLPHAIKRFRPIIELIYDAYSFKYLCSVLSDLSINIYTFKLCKGLVEYPRVVLRCMVLMEIVI